jgi:hypothetical protein
MSRARESLWGQTSAGLLPGLSLACLLSGLLVLPLPVSLEAQVVLAIVLVLPLWVTVWTLCYLFSDGRRAWTWLLLANALSFAALWVAKQAGALDLLA